MVLRGVVSTELKDTRAQSGEGQGLLPPPPPTPSCGCSSAEAGGVATCQVRAGLCTRALRWEGRPPCPSMRCPSREQGHPSTHQASPALGDPAPVRGAEPSCKTPSPHQGGRRGHTAVTELSPAPGLASFSPSPFELPHWLQGKAQPVHRGLGPRDLPADLQAT